MIVHAGLIARRVGGLWLGILIEGPSGAGKSDLALRALDHGFRLVADDRVLLWADGGRLWGRAPDPLAGLIEVRGQGVVPVAAVAFSGVALKVRLEPPERMPDPATETVLGVEIPLMAADPFELSAPAKLGRALEAFDAAHKRRI
ncbi:HPr kinase/phosphorylase [Phenylobacterium sp.]|uniref:HPr kinase/phosphorylase n=1 Tax=Phenylobacterium sp. TaxID=1871053 RepID=UPI0025F2359A|nr:HPr kinase/phosphorylase [Phenylobacterium sp.]MBX3482822.1 HPr kinase/phosphorylase [Phenylobacterium sp.]MCW5758558.1 HPr kinase/phosphorylase [Phenylobacterium sp.]